MIDTLTGGTGADLFVLGTSGGVAYANAGNSDYARILGFDQGAGDHIQLYGNASDYLFGALPTGFNPNSDIAIYKDVNGTGEYSPSQELIAVIQLAPSSSFDLTTSGKYV